MATPQTDRKRPRRTFTMGDDVFELLTQLAEDGDVSRSRLLESFVVRDHEVYELLLRVAAVAAVSPAEFLQRVVCLDVDAYERLTHMARHARVSEAQFLAHLLVRADVVWHFQPPVVPPPRPWWKLWSKEERAPELPAIVADLRNVA